MTAPNSDLGPLLTEIRDSIKEQNAVLAGLVDALTRKDEEKEKEEEKEPEVQVDDTVPVYPKMAIGRDGHLNRIHPDGEKSPVPYDMFKHPVYGSCVVPFRSGAKLIFRKVYETDVLTKAEFDSIKLDGPQPQEGCFLKDWKYWIPAFKQYGERGCLLNVIKTYGGRPDYIPPWELRLHDDGKLYPH